jgi:hypothetical protein
MFTAKLRVLSALTLLAASACSAGGAGEGTSVPRADGGGSGQGGGTAGSGASQPGGGGSFGLGNAGASPLGGEGGSHAGAGGGNGGGGNGGGVSKPGGCADADILCLTFDDLADGALPQMAPFKMYDCAGKSTSTDLLVEAGQGVNGSKAFTSKKSLNGGCNLMADLGDHVELWLTAHVRFSAGVPVGSVHELTPFELTQTATDDPGVRPGIRADSSCNSWQGAELNITGGGERTGCTAFKLATEEWYCLEVHVKNTASAVEGNLFIDSVQQSYHIHQDEAASVVNMDWTGARMLRLGSRSYSASVESPIYVDNLSVSTGRVGCTKP